MSETKFAEMIRNQRKRIAWDVLAGTFVATFTVLASTVIF